MIYSVQYMRAIAALLVVFQHATAKGTQYTSASFEWFTIGNAGVDLFFIISGYIMCHTADSRNIDFIGFIKARIKRIIPLYWVLTTMALVIYLLYPDKVNSAGGGTNILHSYTLIPTKENYLVSNGWTLSYEFFFYFLFAFSLGLTNKYKFLLPVGIIVALVSLGSFNSSNSTIYNFISNPLLLEFAFGILIYYLFKNMTVSRVIGLSLIIVAIGSLFVVNTYQSDLPRVVLYGTPALFFFIGMLSLESLFITKQNTVTSKLFKIIGDSSYSLYLFHPFALVISAMILDKSGITNFSYLFVFLLLISSLVAGYLCYKVLELNLIKLTKGLGKTTQFKNRYS